MAFAAQRRTTGAKYGKNKTKKLGYNFFDTNAASVSEQLPISPESPGGKLQKDDQSFKEPVSPSRTTSPVTFPAHITTHSRTSLSANRSSRSESPLKVVTKAPTTDDAPTFDATSSGDDDNEIPRPSKRRKVQGQNNDIYALSDSDSSSSASKQLRAEYQLAQSSGRETNKFNTIKNSSRALETARRMKSSSAQEEGVEVSEAPETSTLKTRSKKVMYSKKGRAELKSHMALRKEAEADSTMSDASSADVDPPVQTRTLEPAGPDRSQDASGPAPRVKKRAKKAGYGSQNKLGAATKPSPLHDPNRNIDSGEDSSHLGTLSPASIDFAAEVSSTPKRRSRQQNDSDASTTSLGRLGMKDLTLSPKNHTTSRPSTLSPSPSIVTNTPQRGRTRRIDQLDVPEPEMQSSSRDGSGVRVLPSPRPDSKRRTKTQQADSANNVPSLPQAGSSQTRQTYSRTKNTYGKERSHLADMVSDLGILTNSSSQEASQHFASQLAASSGPSQLQMEMELEESSGDDAMPAGKLKSIHELRQAGANNRYERYLETLLEDVDPTPKSAAKSLRVQALMKLFTKMAEEQSFEPFVSDQALDRLAAWSKATKDRLSKLLFDMIFWRLIHVKNMSARKLSAIASSVAASTGQVTDLGTVARLVKDRQENVSKSLAKELQIFEHLVLSQKMLSGYEGEHIVPAAISIAALNDALRRLVEASTNNVAVGQTAYAGIVAILKRASQLNDAGALQNTFVAKTALSLLQLFCGPMQSNLGLQDFEYIELGDTLSIIVDTSTNHREDVVQSVLHFAISLCNDRPQICSSVCASRLNTSLISIIKARFLGLVKSASAGDTVESTMLDSIILSLACLLNLTEYDNVVRRKFAHATTEVGITNLQELADIYTQAAPKLVETTTAEQSQALVAFGYLSLLICNLCLDSKLWKESQKLLGTYSVTDVVISAKELLIHLRTLEEMVQMEGEVSILGESAGGAMDGFTQRFEQIIAQVRVDS